MLGDDEFSPIHNQYLSLPKIFIWFYGFSSNFFFQSWLVFRLFFYVQIQILPFINCSWIYLKSSGNWFGVWLIWIPNLHNGPLHDKLANCSEAVVLAATMCYPKNLILLLAFIVLCSIFLWVEEGIWNKAYLFAENFYQILQYQILS